MGSGWLTFAANCPTQASEHKGAGQMSCHDLTPCHSVIAHSSDQTSIIGHLSVPISHIFVVPTRHIAPLRQPIVNDHHKPNLVKLW